MISVSHWRDIEALGIWRWAPLFTPLEMACTHCGALVVQEAFMDRMLRLRMAHNRPIAVISGYRCKQHPLEVIKKKPGLRSHTKGRAIDPGVPQVDVGRVMRIARDVGFTRCGLHFAKDRFQLHLDDLPTDRKDGDMVLWPY